MLAREAADFYWLGRYAQRIEQTARLLEYQVIRLVDRPADGLAAGWQMIYRVLGQIPPGEAVSGDEAEVFLIPDAYTLAGKLVEEGSNPDSILSCWRRARENARRVRAHLPLSVWTCLNQGYLWMEGSSFPEAWAEAPVVLAREIINRFRLFSGVVNTMMFRDDAWRFLELGRFIERAQHQATLLAAWVEFARAERAAAALSWADLLHVCGAYEVYCRRHSMRVSQKDVLGFLVRAPELPRSLRFSLQQIEEMLVGIDPMGARYPLSPPHRMALRLTAAIEMEAVEIAGEEDARAVFHAIRSNVRTLHDLTMSAYVNHSPTEEPPA